MGTSVKSLLDIMSVRLAMYDAGTIRPAKVVADATRALVQRLGGLEPTEDIEVFILDREPLHAQYIRTRTGEVLAEIDETKSI